MAAIEICVMSLKVPTVRSPVSLFLDDERFPPEDGREWAIVRTVPAAVAWIVRHGLPAHLSFDNDLQRRLEGRHLARWLIRKDFEAGGTFLPDDFSWCVHSQNSVNGIDDLLEDWLRDRARHLGATLSAEETRRTRPH